MAAETPCPECGRPMLVLGSVGICEVCSHDEPADHATLHSVNLAAYDPAF